MENQKIVMGSVQIDSGTLDKMDARTGGRRTTKHSSVGSDISTWEHSLMRKAFKARKHIKTHAIRSIGATTAAELYCIGPLNRNHQKI